MAAEIQVCPNCGSGEVSKPAYSLASIAIAMFLIGLPIPFLRKRVHCFDCFTDFPVSKAASVNE